MRVTSRSMSNNMLHNLNSGLSRMDKLQSQLATGKLVQRPSDSPGSVGSIMRLKTSLAETEQYIRNSDDAYGWLDSTDTVLDNLTHIMHRVRELTVYGASESLNAADRGKIASEIEQLSDNVLDLANSTHGGKYLFAGQKTRTQPFQRVPGGLPDYQGGLGDASPVVMEVGVSAPLVLNVVGQNEEAVFAPTFRALSDVVSMLKNDDARGLSSYLQDLDVVMDNLLEYRSEIGAKTNRVELAKERLLDMKINISRLLSNAQDVDVAEAIMHLKAEENVYRTALSVGARIIQPSLVDFLR